MIDKWHTVHAFRKLAARGTIDPLRCLRCDGELMVRIGAGDDPVFQCWACDITITPGLAMWTDMQRQIDRAERR